MIAQAGASDPDRNWMRNRRNNPHVSGARRLLTIGFACLCLGQVFSMKGSDLEYTPVILPNPMKGFVSNNSGPSDFPHSLEYIAMPLNRLMSGYKNFDWEPLEKPLNSIAARGCQSIIRVAFDLPGGRTGLPQFLIEARMKTHVLTERRGWYREGDVVPDYDDEHLRAALRGFISAFGARYDGDSRIGFIEAGLLGTWGEWFVWGKPEWFASEEVQREVLDAYEKSFRSTKILVRWPSPLTVIRPLGYHDDWFGHPTGGFENRFGKLPGASRMFWRMEPLGGRVHPELRDAFWDEQISGPSDEQFMDRITRDHFSYLRLSAGFDAIPESARPKALKWASRLGYELYIAKANFEAGSPDEALGINIEVVNTGVAPFYYPWPAEVSAYRNAKIEKTWRTDWVFARVMPGEGARNLRQSILRPGLAPGHYRILLRMINPLPTGLPVRFANKTQDADVQGWVTLGELEIR